jgi:hypothetical protein
MILPAEGLGALVKSSPGSFFTMSKPFFFLSRFHLLHQGLIDRFFKPRLKSRGPLFPQSPGRTRNTGRDFQ